MAEARSRALLVSGWSRCQNNCPIPTRGWQAFQPANQTGFLAKAVASHVCTNLPAAVPRPRSKKRALHDCARQPPDGLMPSCFHRGDLGGWRSGLVPSATAVKPAFAPGTSTLLRDEEHLCLIATWYDPAQGNLVMSDQHQSPAISRTIEPVLAETPALGPTLQLSGSGNSVQMRQRVKINGVRRNRSDLAG